MEDPKRQASVTQVEPDFTSSGRRLYLIDRPGATQVLSLFDQQSCFCTSTSPWARLGPNARNSVWVYICIILMHHSHEVLAFSGLVLGSSCELWLPIMCSQQLTPDGYQNSLRSDLQGLPKTCFCTCSAILCDLDRQSCVLQATVAMGEIGVQMSDPDTPALDILNEILNSFGGRLFNEIRSKEVRLSASLSTTTMPF